MEVQVSETLPSIVIDMARLELILMNLVSNAINTAIPRSHSVLYTWKPSHRRTRILPASSCATMAWGSRESSQATVFRRFVRAHADRDAELKVRGSGLGLTIAAECVEAVGGSIRVESTVGLGTGFFDDPDRTASDRSKREASIRARAGALP